MILQAGVVPGDVLGMRFFYFGGVRMKNILISNPVEPGKELTITDYIDEMRLVVKPVLETLFKVDFSDCEKKDSAAFNSLLYSTLERWTQIDAVFDEHNKAIQKN